MGGLPAVEESCRSVCKADFQGRNVGAEVGVKNINSTLTHERREWRIKSSVGKVHEYSSKGEVSIGLASTSIAPTWPVVLPYGKQVPTTN
ncbi:MAG: hypothetical protein DRJ49_05720, partial [Thermoprotei archaeon]